MTGVAAKALSLEGLRRDMAKRLRANGIDTPELDARLLVGHALQLDHAGLVRAATTGSHPAEIAGTKRWWRGGSPASLSRALPACRNSGACRSRSPAATLVPRPETETVVEAALAAVGKSHGRGLRIADLGTGSGAIMLALLAELPEAIAIGTDRDRAAIAVARHNAARLSLASRAMFQWEISARRLRAASTLWSRIRPMCAPATSPHSIRKCADHEPLCARRRAGWPCGLPCDRGRCRRLLAPRAPLVVEIGIGQSDAVAALIVAAGLRDIAIAPDLACMPRAITARRYP